MANVLLLGEHDGSGMQNADIQNKIPSVQLHFARNIEELLTVLPGVGNIDITVFREIFMTQKSEKNPEIVNQMPGFVFRANLLKMGINAFNIRFAFEGSAKIIQSHLAVHKPKQNAELGVLKGNGVTVGSTFKHESSIPELVRVIMESSQRVH